MQLGGLFKGRKRGQQAKKKVIAHLAEKIEVHFVSKGNLQNKMKFLHIGKKEQILHLKDVTI